MNPDRALIADFSLALINRTGAYYACRDLVAASADFVGSKRFWRFRLSGEPSGLIRKCLAKAMLAELKLRAAGLPLGRGTPSPRRGRVLFLDPLYVLFSGVSPRDIVLCHDVGPLTMPALFDRRTVQLYQAAYSRIAQARPGIVLVSAFSRDQFTSLFGSDFRFLDVIPLYTRAASTDGLVERPEAVARPFLLTVGALERRKNFERSIEAYVQSGLVDEGVDYLICGPRGYGSAALETLIADTPGVRWLGYLKDSEVRWMYRNACGFVLPSLLEGFGLPALEAATNGLVPIVSNEGALVEAVNDGALMVNPRSVPQISSAMRQLVRMSGDEKNRRLARLHAHADAMSFERFAMSWRTLLRRET
ncbi:hypothetical protein GCM10007301_02220 [Azorhizobium oxalatiphilum]|uniref:Glycosyl transferase family 1 domain-containing protein n=1 Tax=Azorhizobium oxalatiphilum TaxID=980631 RepID=A0A917BK37_9HYPH|nr:glycosyltransferase [Azorhizobium oxalatiphilum]GGF46257.1 hypothetical protein GCM10007301_02220 [Azorhizobium oxalatiphilum]